MDVAGLFAACFQSRPSFLNLSFSSPHFGLASCFVGQQATEGDLFWSQRSLTNHSSGGQYMRFISAICNPNILWMRCKHLQTLQLTKYLHFRRSIRSRILCKPELSIHIVKYSCIHRVIKKSLCTWWLQYRSRVHWDFLINLYNRVQFLSKLRNLDSNRPQHYHPTARVNAQQHSPLAFILLCSYSRKEKFGIL